ncbi:hypothetical protein BZA70DRAFT_273140 [Myxozyma melibiosi]|uniref:histidine kinase n=1 Tax=Myxozyma melibiosi TaxID=54550 RepID=A0ABR1FEB4_9ASCO
MAPGDSPDLDEQHVLRPNVRPSSSSPRPLSQQDSVAQIALESDNIATDLESSSKKSSRKMSPAISLKHSNDHSASPASTYYSSNASISSSSLNGSSSSSAASSTLTATQFPALSSSETRKQPRSDSPIKLTLDPTRQSLESLREAVNVAQLQSYQNIDRMASPVSAGASSTRTLSLSQEQSAHSYMGSPVSASPDFTFSNSSRTLSASEDSLNSTNFPSRAVMPNMSEATDSTQSFTSSRSARHKIIPDFAEMEHPSPKLYDLTLKLNSDPGLYEFWNNLTEVLESVYMAKRASLIVPNDLTDIANTPWGLKGVWTSKNIPWTLSRLQHYRDLRVSDHSEDYNASHSTDNDDSEWEDMFEGSDGEDASFAPNSSRNSLVSENDGELTDEDTEYPRHTRTGSAGSDLDNLPFLSRKQENVESGVAKIYTSLRPLESDVDPIIDSLGVSRVLHRGKVAVLQREYRNLQRSPESQPNGSKPEELKRPAVLAGSRKHSTVSTVSDASTITEQRPSLPHRNAFTKSKKKPMLRDPFDNGSVSAQALYNLPYEDYEQCLLSPWSHSPAPSPALSKDSKENPFFNLSEQTSVEEAFASPSASEDNSPIADLNYPVRAIGLESSYSVIHIPLVHPSLSHPVRNTTGSRKGKQCVVPIAIVSILSDVIPYPVNLIKSLGNFAPHIAASYALAEAHANLKYQVEHSRSLHALHHRRGQRSRSSVLSGYSRKSSTSSTRSYNGPQTSTGNYFGLSNLSSSEASSRTSTPTWESATNTVANSPIGLLEQSESISSTPTASTFVSAPSSAKPSPAESPGVEIQSPRPSQTQFRYRNQSKSVASSYFRNASPPPKSPISSFSSSTSPLPESSSSAMQPPHRGARSTFPRGDSLGSGVARMAPPPPRLLRTIIDSIPVHLYISEPQTGTVTWVSARTLAYCGLSPDEFCRQPPEQRFHPDDRETFLRAWKSALKNGDPLSLQLRMRRFDGAYRFFVVREVPLRDSKGSIVHWFGTSMDIHEQRIAELESIKQSEKLASERKYRTLAESSPLIVFAATLSDGIIYTNNQWSGYSGQSIESSQRFGFLEFVHPEDRPKCVLPVAGESHTFSCEVRLRDSGGDYKWHLVRCVSSEDQANTSSTPGTGLGPDIANHILPNTSISPSGDPVWFGTCTDINDHKLVEEKLQEAKDTAQRTMESKARFLSNMSHEIRTPLIGISGMVNFLLDTTLTSEQLDYCHTISSSSEALLSVINDILDLSKAEAGKMRLNKEWFNIRWLVEDTNELLGTLAISKNLELNYIVNEDVPAVVNGDRIRIRQVLLNIIGNAIKFTSHGEVFTRCSVKARENDVITLHFECHDTGAGFDKEDEALMFKPFSQIDSTMTRRHGGSGLGLVISKQLIELHGGSIHCRGEKGKGSTFYFSAEFGLPTEEDHPSMSPLSRSSLHRYASVSSSSSDSHSAALDKHSPFSLRPGAIAGVIQIPGATQTPGPMLPSPISEYTLPSPGSKSPGSKSISLLSPGSTSQNPLATEVTMEQMSQLKPAKDPRMMRLRLPSDPHRHKTADSSKPSSSLDVPTSGRQADNNVFALIVSEYHFATEAIIYHIREALPHDCFLETAHVSNYEAASELLGVLQTRLPAPGERTPFTHVVINVTDYTEIASLAAKVFLSSTVYANTKVVAVTTPMQKTAILQNLRANGADAPSSSRGSVSASGSSAFSSSHRQRGSAAGSDGLVDYNILEREMGTRFFCVSKPLKVSRLSPIFNSRSKSSATESVQSLGTPGESPGEITLSTRGDNLEDADAAKRATNSKRSIFRDLQSVVEGHNYRVLLVEDNPVNQKVLQKFLKRGGLEVDTVSDGEECVQKVYSVEPGYYSLIVCDLHMPRKDGFQTCAELRRWEEVNNLDRCPMVALSANVMSDVAEKCQMVGFSRYVSKPIDFTVFKSVIVDLLSENEEKE